MPSNKVCYTYAKPINNFIKMKKIPLLLLSVILVATSCTKKNPESSSTCYCYYFQAGGVESRIRYPLNGGRTRNLTLQCIDYQTKLQGLYGIPNAKCAIE
jgi:hypothetical protein